MSIRKLKIYIKTFFLLHLEVETYLTGTRFREFEIPGKFDTVIQSFVIVYVNSICSSIESYKCCIINLTNIILN